jgi:hypothetical protein
MFLAVVYIVHLAKKKMTWFQDNNCHILESKSSMHRLLYCSLCQKLISKTQCQKLRQDKHGKLYKVKTYHYDNLSKIESAKRKEQKETKRLQELSNIELTRIANHIFNNNDQLNL